ncbi:hypothetical protein PJI17_31250, partial [Mycobacterium kansasii]
MGKSRNNKYVLGYEKARTRTGYGTHGKSDISSNDKGKNLTYPTTGDSKDMMNKGYLHPSPLNLSNKKKDS